MKILSAIFSTNWLSGFFRWLKEVIEEADRPISLLIIVLLPFIAPIIPALVTANHLITYMNYTPEMATLAAVAFALVGYASMITAIGSIMNFVDQEHNKRVWLPVVVTVGSYLVYVTALVVINVVLEINSGVEGTQTFVTALLTLGLEIPASLLNGTRINNRDAADRKDREREENRKYNLERYKIKHGKSVESSTKVSSDNGKFQESSKKPESWRKVRTKLSKTQLESLANATPDEMRTYASQTGFTYKTISNWRQNARDELGMRED